MGAIVGASLVGAKLVFVYFANEVEARAPADAMGLAKRLVVGWT